MALIHKTYKKVTPPQKVRTFQAQEFVLLLYQTKQRVVKIMALKDLAAWNTKKSEKTASSACGSACGASDEKKAYTACGAGDNK